MFSSSLFFIVFLTISYCKLQHINSLINIKIVYPTNNKKIKEKKQNAVLTKIMETNAFHGVLIFFNFFYETVA